MSGQIEHHIPQDWLLDYASGAMTGPWTVLVASHLTLCPVCRTAVSDLERIGGALLSADLGLDRPSATAQAIVVSTDTIEPLPGTPAPKVFDPVLPKPLRDAIGGSLNDLRWRGLLPGVETAETPDSQDGARARLLRIAPGAAVPDHTHHGAEATLILQGAYADETGHYRAGDVAVADHEVDHRPVADHGMVCICYSVSEAPLQLTGRFGRFLNFLPMV